MTESDILHIWNGPTSVCNRAKILQFAADLETRLRAESPQEPVACKHEPFEGFCIHCGVLFSNGHALSAPESVTWQMCDAGIAAAGKGYMNHDKISAEDAEIIFLAMLAASKESK